MKYALFALTVAVALLVSGCCAGCGISDPDTRRTIFADDLDRPSNNSTVYGVWSSSGASVVDPGIGFDSGSGPDDGQWYMFKEGGFFKYVNVSTENNARNGLYREGSFRVDGNRLQLWGVDESYYPGRNSRMSSYRNKAVADESLTYELLDNNTLAIHGGVGNGTYYRLY